MSQFNMRSPAVKRLMREAQELKDPTEEYFAQPLEDNLFEWHFTVRGPSDSDYSEGFYHGRIILPTEYPMKPPSIIILTPNGRFETNKKICLSISGHHPESWQPSWSIRTALLAIIGFMPTEALGAIGSLDYSSEERKALALKSQSWTCPTCGLVKNLLKEKSANAHSEPESEENKNEKELAKQIRFKGGETGPTEKSPIANTKAALESKATENVPSVTAEAENAPRLRHQAPTSQQHSPTSSSSPQAQATNIVPSRTRKSTYVIIVLSAAIGFLIFRRLFLIA